MIKHLRLLAAALLELAGGACLAALLLELVFRANPTLLPRGISAMLPVDAPLTDRIYDVRYLDADIFYWQSSSVQPPEQNVLEARVHWRTDEFGFPNPVPIPPKVDLVILGRSYSMGAQAELPWPDILREDQGLVVLNLAQTGAGIDQKKDYFERFGLPRHPQFLVIDVLPPMDFLECQASDPLMIDRALWPFAQGALRKLFPAESGNSPNWIYPLSLEISGRPVDAVFYSYYLSALSLSTQDWSNSRCWEEYQTSAQSLIKEARENGIVPILLFIPSKETVILPLVSSIKPLEPALAVAGSWREAGGELVSSSAETNPNNVRVNADAARNVVASFASSENLCLVDPTGEFAHSLKAGEDPFMVYDTHWSAIGHRIVADEIAAAIQSGACR